MRSSIEQIRKSDYFIGEGGLPVGAPVGMNGPVAAPSGAGPTSVSTTNTQVAGVDEPDFVQNDGTRIAVLAGGMLHLLRSWPAQDMAEAASLKIDGWPRQMFLAGDQVVVFSDVYIPRAIEGVTRFGAPSPVAVGGAGVVAVHLRLLGKRLHPDHHHRRERSTHPKVTARSSCPARTSPPGASTTGSGW